MQKQYYDFIIWQIIIKMDPMVHSEELREKILNALDSSLSQCIQNLSL
jgi:RNA binding exosome subunit